MRKRRGVLMDLDAPNLAFAGSGSMPVDPHISSNSKVYARAKLWSPKMMTLLGSVLRLPVVKFVEPVRTNAFCASSRSPTMNLLCIPLPMPSVRKWMGMLSSMALRPKLAFCPSAM